jgi:hypothetical protein
VNLRNIATTSVKKLTAANVPHDRHQIALDIIHRSVDYRPPKGSSVSPPWPCSQGRSQSWSRLSESMLIPGTSWDRNSCWLDAMIHILSAVAIVDHDAWASLALTGAEDGTLFAHIRSHINNHVRMVEEFVLNTHKTTASRVQHELDESRNLFRTLMANEVIYNADHIAQPFVSFSPTFYNGSPYALSVSGILGYHVCSKAEVRRLYIEIIKHILGGSYGNNIFLQIPA